MGKAFSGGYGVGFWRLWYELFELVLSGRRINLTTQLSLPSCPISIIMYSESIRRIMGRGFNLQEGSQCSPPILVLVTYPNVQSVISWLSGETVVFFLSFFSGSSSQATHSIHDHRWGPVSTVRWDSVPTWSGSSNHESPKCPSSKTESRSLDTYLLTILSYRLGPGTQPVPHSAPRVLTLMAVVGHFYNLAIPPSWFIT